MNAYAWIAIGGVLTLGSVLIACQSVRRSLEASELQSGTESAITEEGAFALRSNEEFAEFWKSHTKRELPTPPLPDVDFETSMVVGVFAGACPTAGYGVEIVDVQAKGERLVVQARRRTPAADAVVAQMITSPFVLVTSERVKAAAELEVELDWVD